MERRCGWTTRRTCSSRPWILALVRTARGHCWKRPPLHAMEVVCMTVAWNRASARPSQADVHQPLPVLGFSRAVIRECDDHQVERWVGCEPPTCRHVQVPATCVRTSLSCVQRPWTSGVVCPGELQALVATATRAKPVFVLFTEPACAHCYKANRVFEQGAGHFNGFIRFARVRLLDLWVAAGCWWVSLVCAILCVCVATGGLQR